MRARAAHHFSEEEAVLLLGHLHKLSLEHLARWQVAQRLELLGRLPHGLDERHRLLSVALQRVRRQPADRPRDEARTSPRSEHLSLA
jgi:hypothetical protein